MPPPGYWEYTIEIEPGGAGRVSVLRDYPSWKVRAWKEKFTVHPLHLDWLYGIMTENHLFDSDWSVRGEISVGGGGESMRVHANGRDFSISPHPAERWRGAAAKIYDSLRALVPAEMWASLTARREKYVRRYRASH